MDLAQLGVSAVQLVPFAVVAAGHNWPGSRLVVAAAVVAVAAAEVAVAHVAADNRLVVAGSRLVVGAARLPALP